MQKRKLWCVRLLLFMSGAVFSATTVSDDMQALQSLTNWQASEGSSVIAGKRQCGIQLDQFDARRLDHEVSSQLHDREATDRIKALDEKVVAFLNRHGWKKIDAGQNDGGIPNLHRCYQKNGAVAQIFQTTGRCTMNTPCTAYDGFALTFYIPRQRP